MGIAAMLRCMWAGRKGGVVVDMLGFICGNQNYFEDFITRSTYHSNAIEGNTLSYAETYAIIFNDNSLTISATAQELHEAINHKYAIDYIFKHLQEPLSEKMIKDIAQLINRNINEIGGYRAHQVFIRNAEHIPPIPQIVPSQMMYWVYNYNNTEFQSIFEKAASAHIAFERIHPFEDGNGRTGRLLVNYELIRNNTPPVVIPKETRAQYLAFLAENNVGGLAQFFKELSSEEQRRIERFTKPTLQPQQKPPLEP